MSDGLMHRRPVIRHGLGMTVDGVYLFASGANRRPGSRTRLLVVRIEEPILDGPSLAALLEAREVPRVRERRALVRLHRVDGTAVVVSEEDASGVGAVGEHQPPAIGPEPGIPIDELLGGQPEVLGHSLDFCGAHADVPLPFAAAAATGAFVPDSGPQLHWRGVLR